MYVYWYRKTIHSACLYIRPEIITLESQFYLIQFWSKIIQKVGSNSEYESDRSVISEWLLIIFGMVFIKSENMCDYFNYELMTTMSGDDRLTQYFCYISNINILFADFFLNIWA